MRTEYLKQVTYLNKSRCSLKRIRSILRLTYPREAVLSIDKLKKLLIAMRRRSKRKTPKVKKPPYNKTPDSITRLILKSCIESNGLQSTPDLQTRITSETGRSISTRTIRRIRRIYGYRYRRLRKGPHLTELHKLNRLNWCLTHQHTDFSNYVFVDETSVRLWDLPLYHWRLRSCRPEVVPMTEKYRNKLNVWGGMSFKGLTRFAVSETFNLKSINRNLT